MKQLFIIAVAFLVVADATAQSWPGLTGKPDTSYNTNAAYRNSVKSNPETKYVEEFHSANTREKKGIVYCSIGERKLLLDAFYPKAKTKKKRTAIIIIHGGGWRSGNRTQHYPLAQHLASLGYVCFTPEYRLSTESLYPAAVNDVKAAVRWVKENAKKYSVDTNEIAVLGFSAGGQLAALTGNTNGNALFEGTGCGSKYSSNVQAIVDIDGTLTFVHPESGEGDDSKRISAATNWFGASKKDNPELWKQASPLTWAGKNSVPTLFINSSVDRMHAGRNDYIKILYENGIYTDVKKFENSPHHFCLFSPWFEPTVKYIDDFLKKVFKK
ncbi:MAG TPA: alpha/beta hydrolase [Ferruginibacter sp.]|nr:esterase [Chitinophagaceae bacterium]HRI24915.1 alpha/beta hydrolase [Ferruginibacter sp.]